MRKIRKIDCVAKDFKLNAWIKWKVIGIVKHVKIVEKKKSSKFVN